MRRGRMLEVTLTHHSVIVKEVQLSEKSSNPSGDLIIDRHGRVQFRINSSHSFYIDIHELPITLLQEISQQIQNKDVTRITHEKINRVTRSLSGTNEAH
jgi:hypothetical protein